MTAATEVRSPVAQSMESFARRAADALHDALPDDARALLVPRLTAQWRGLVRVAAGLPRIVPADPDLDDLTREFAFLWAQQATVAPVFRLLRAQRVLFAGQSYYHTWYLSRALRQTGWTADVLNWDLDPATQIYYHGHDIGFDPHSPNLLEQMLRAYLDAVYAYDVFHFSNMHGLSFGAPVGSFMTSIVGEAAEIRLLKGLGKKIVYSNNACADGVSQSRFAQWGPHSACSICRWRQDASVCSDSRNLAWGAFRNEMADFQCLSGGNHADFNDDPRVHEVAEFYCLDPMMWHPDLEIPDVSRLPRAAPGTVRLYHAVGHRAQRTGDDGVNIKSSHVYLPLVERLRADGLPIELIAPTGLRNLDVRYLQAQADIVLEMLTYGWFGANVREAMMLGKPVVCYIRPEWLDSVRAQMPAYADELPIVSATPETVDEVVRALIADPARRRDIGQRSRTFALKWHSAEAGARRFDGIYRSLLAGETLTRACGGVDVDTGRGVTSADQMRILTPPMSENAPG